MAIVIIGSVVTLANLLLTTVHTVLGNNVCLASTLCDCAINIVISIINLVRILWTVVLWLTTVQAMALDNGAVIWMTAWFCGYKLIVIITVKPLPI